MKRALLLVLWLALAPGLALAQQMIYQPGSSKGGEAPCNAFGTGVGKCAQGSGAYGFTDGVVTINTGGLLQYAFTPNSASPYNRMAATGIELDYNLAPAGDFSSSITPWLWNVNSNWVNPTTFYPADPNKNLGRESLFSLDAMQFTVQADWSLPAGFPQGTFTVTGGVVQSIGAPNSATYPHTYLPGQAIQVVIESNPRPTTLAVATASAVTDGAGGYIIGNLVLVSGGAGYTSTTRVLFQPPAAGETVTMAPQETWGRLNVDAGNVGSTLHGIVSTGPVIKFTGTVLDSAFATVSGSKAVHVTWPGNPGFATNDILTIGRVDPPALIGGAYISGTFPIAGYVYNSGPNNATFTITLNAPATATATGAGNSVPYWEGQYVQYGVEPWRIHTSYNDPHGPSACKITNTSNIGTFPINGNNRGLSTICLDTYTINAGTIELQDTEAYQNFSPTLYLHASGGGAAAVVQKSSVGLGNVGNGTLSGLASLTGAQLGLYVATATDATHFTVVDPSGNTVATATVGTPFATQIGFTITAGSTAFVAGDYFEFISNGIAGQAGSIQVAVEDSATPPATSAFARQFGVSDSLAAGAVTGHWEFQTRACASPPCAMGNRNFVIGNGVVAGSSNILDEGYGTANFQNGLYINNAVRVDLNGVLRPFGTSIAAMNALASATVKGSLGYMLDAGSLPKPVYSNGTAFGSVNGMSYAARTNSTGAVTLTPITSAQVQRFTNTLSGNLTVTLATGAQANEWFLVVAPANLNAHTFTVVDGGPNATNWSLTANQYSLFVYDGADWQLVETGWTNGVPAPSATTLGGVNSIAAVTSNFLTSLSTAGAFTAAQPAFTDISGAATFAQVPGGTTVYSTTGSHVYSVVSGTRWLRITYWGAGGGGAAGIQCATGISCSGGGGGGAGAKEEVGPIDVIGLGITSCTIVVGIGGTVGVAGTDTTLSCNGSAPTYRKAGGGGTGTIGTAATASGGGASGCLGFTGNNSVAGAGGTSAGQFCAVGGSGVNAAAATTFGQSTGGGGSSITGVGGTGGNTVGGATGGGSGGGCATGSVGTAAKGGASDLGGVAIDTVGNTGTSGGVSGTGGGGGSAQITTTNGNDGRAGGAPGGGGGGGGDNCNGGSGLGGTGGTGGNGGAIIVAG